ncbi:MAG: ferrous iron transporter B, partial [Candidatus Methanomethylophilus sp.]|nr:ferrous iron transporter B [Methanomethylophilus sp.]
MITAALIGNPNSGKTTVFNKLTGSVQKTGNWPGVTVDRKEGFIRTYTKEKILIVDLPGIYSMSPYSPEEVVSRDYLIGTQSDKPDVAINIIDASNIERGLYLLTQVADLGIPMVVILNMMDVAEKSGMKVDAAKLSEALGCEVVQTVGIRNQGTEAIAEAVQRARDEHRVPGRIHYGEALEACISKVSPVIAEGLRPELVRWVSIKLLERDPMVLADLGKEKVDAAMEIITAFEKEAGDDGIQMVATARYDTASRIQEHCLTRVEPSESANTLSDRIDRILLNRVAGIFIFVAVMFLVYFIAVQTVGTMAVDFINDGFMQWVS